MPGEQVTRRVYSAEELHRLRASCSQPKLREAIEEHDGEDAELVKEHVLRGSRSFAARSFRSRTSGNSLRVPSNKENRSTADAENSRQSSGQHEALNVNVNVLGEIAPNGQILRPGTYKVRPSPTPSLKKRKAEAIVKAHGSPQHVRVTAGGRIVPSEQSPLCHPRYGYSAIKANGGLVKFAPNHPMGKAQWTQATQNGFVAQDVDGRLCQIVNGTILPLNEIDGALRLYMPAPNLNISSRGSSFGPSAPGRVSSNGNQQPAMPQNKPSGPPDPPLPAQTNALELEYSKLEHELKDLDKTEVLHGRTMGKAAKEALVTKRRELVISLDNIRKAIKSIKSMPPLDAPLSPRAMQNRQSISPPRNRLPPFLQQHPSQINDMSVQPVPSAYGQYFNPPQHHHYSGQYGFQTTPSPDAVYDHPPFAMAQQPLFVPPPPSFDGSMAPPFNSYQDPMAANVPAPQQIPPAVAVPTDGHNADARVPQTDGARSFADLQRVVSPGRPHAVDIRPPEAKPAAALKSNLNPMSPAYKPGNGILPKSGNASAQTAKPVQDRVPTLISPAHQLKPAAATNKAASATEDSISPAKKSSHLHSSSASSFETADFFPRNTREYSTRKYAYPESTEHSADKENINHGQVACHDEGSPNHENTDKHHSDENYNTNTASSGGHNTPPPPPGTPVVHDASSRPELPLRLDKGSLGKQSHGFDCDAVPDRQTHNLSPKARRQDYLFVEEHPSQLPSLPSSSPEKFQSCHEEPHINSSPPDSLDLSNMSKEWIEGCRAGLARKPIEPERAGDFLDGYCAGLLKSKPSKIGPSTGSPIKSVSRRPSPVVIQSRSSSRLQQLDRREPVPTLSPFENSLHSMDTLKEAVFAPQNENAILTPAADGPHVNEAHFNLGGWAKNQELAASAEAFAHTPGDGLAGFPFPYRTGSMMRRQGVMSEDDAMLKQHFQRPMMTSECAGSFASEPSSNLSPHGMSAVSTSTASLNPGMATNKGHRITSITSIDSNLYSQWPGARVFSNQLEWKSASSVAQAAGFASGHFSQFDGASERSLRRHSDLLTPADTNIGTDAPHSHRPESITSNSTMQNHGRFKEASLDGITNPPNSPQGGWPLSSPPMPAKDNSPSKVEKKKDSPGKGNSPAKIKFENIAEKVGIKVSGGGKKEEGGSPNSPPGKRRWRDVWRTGARKDADQDNGAFASSSYA